MQNKNIIKALKRFELFLKNNEFKKAEKIRSKGNGTTSKFNVYDMDGKIKKPHFVLIPKSKMRLYALDSIYGCLFFDSLDEVFEHIKNSDINLCNYCYIIDYIGDMGGMSDVVRLSSYRECKYLTALSKDESAFYDFDSSFLNDRDCWVYEYRSLDRIYSEFEKRNIELKTAYHKISYKKPNTKRQKIYKFDVNND